MRWPNGRVGWWGRGRDFQRRIARLLLLFCGHGLVFSPLVLVLATALVVMILYSREFRSDVLHVLRD